MCNGGQIPPCSGKGCSCPSSHSWLSTLLPTAATCLSSSALIKEPPPPAGLSIFCLCIFSRAADVLEYLVSAVFHLSRSKKLRSEVPGLYNCRRANTDNHCEGVQIVQPWALGLNSGVSCSVALWFHHSVLSTARKWIRDILLCNRLYLAKGFTHTQS